MRGANTAEGETHNRRFAWRTPSRLWRRYSLGFTPSNRRNVLERCPWLEKLPGYGIARRIEQISGDLLAVNQGTLYPVPLKLEQEGAIASEWGAFGEQSPGALL